MPGHSRREIAGRREPFGGPRSDFADRDHDAKRAALERSSTTAIRTEIDRMLGRERAEYSGASAHQFSKGELSLILLALGEPLR